MSDPIKDYARAVVETALFACRDELQKATVEERMDALVAVRNVALRSDAIIATVPAPVMQHHAAPTCDGQWWARFTDDGDWMSVDVGPAGLFIAGRAEPMRADDFDRWVGPLPPPDTTEPAPEVQAQIECRRCGAPATMHLCEEDYDRHHWEAHAAGRQQAQAQIEEAYLRGVMESAGIVERCGLDGLRDRILELVGHGKVRP